MFAKEKEQEKRGPTAALYTPAAVISYSSSRCGVGLTKARLLDTLRLLGLHAAIVHALASDFKLRGNGGGGRFREKALLAVTAVLLEIYVAAYICFGRSSCASGRRRCTVRPFLLGNPPSPLPLVHVGGGAVPPSFRLTCHTTQRAHAHVCTFARRQSKGVVQEAYLLPAAIVSKRREPANTRLRLLLCAHVFIYALLTHIGCVLSRCLDSALLYPS